VAVKCSKCSAENPDTLKFCGECGTRLVPSDGPKDIPTQTLETSGIELSRGTVFAGRYEVLDELGSGGMGKVYRVYDRKLQEDAALKVIRPEIAADRKTIERFKNELKVARKIAHPHICRMYDLGEDGGLHFIAMEYVVGEDLRSFVRRSGHLTSGKAVSIAKQVCEGLAEAHRFGVVHRDLKSSNIMIDREGNARIMDFGIARTLESREITGLGIIVGTAEYMSPEQARGQKVDQRTDLYALGIVLYETVTGRVPFEDEITLNILRKHEIEQPRPPKALNPEITDSLNRLILKCLEKNPERRYQTAGELLRDLDAVQTTSVKAVRVRARTERRPVVRAGGPVWRRVLVLAVGVFVLAAAAYLLFRPAARRDRTGPSAPGAKSDVITSPGGLLAVLPFEVVSLDSRYLNLGKGLADGVRTCLSVAGLDILSPKSSEELKVSSQRAEGMQKARVDRYLEGTARIEKEFLSVSVNLIDSATEAITWARVYDRKFEGGLGSVVDEISLDVARQVRQPLSADELRAVQKRGTSNIDAVIAMYAGNEAEKKYRESGSEGDYLESLRSYEKAVALDPNFCLAYVNLGNLYEARFVDTSQEADLRAMVQAYQRAHDLDPSVPQVHEGLGWAYFHQGQFDSAYAAFKRALTLAPNDAGVNLGAASFLRSVGLDELAVKHYERAIKFDPLDHLSYYLDAASYWTLGDHRNADFRIRQALVIKPDSPAMILWHSRILISLMNLEEAEKELLAVEKIEPLRPDVQSAVRSRRALIAALRGDRDVALKLIERETDLFRYEITNAYGVLGLKDEAVLRIKRGNEEAFQLIKDYLYPYPYLMTNPFFEGLRRDPGFQEIVRKEEAKFRAKMKKYGDL
jgi:tetratricopeptide (TPR) repeat protein/tRNA A-37 threonylcarbamoyl transferase component Bud32